MIVEREPTIWDDFYALQAENAALRQQLEAAQKGLVLACLEGQRQALMVLEKMHRDGHGGDPYDGCLCTPCLYHARILAGEFRMMAWKEAPKMETSRKETR